MPWAVHWSSLFVPDVSPLEIFVRGSVVYLAILALLRLTFRRETGSLGTTDILVIVLLADAAQNGLAGSYSSISDGVMLVATLLFWTIALDFASYRWAWARALLQRTPRPLIEGGRVNRGHLRRELMTEDELRTELRQRGIDGFEQVELAQLEPDGQLSVVLKDREALQPPNRPAV